MKKLVIGFVGILCVNLILITEISRGADDCVIYRPSTGLWASRGSRFYFGGSSDIPLFGDPFGLGGNYPIIFRPSTGLWAVPFITRFYFGASGDVPLVPSAMGTGGDSPWNQNGDDIYYNSGNVGIGTSWPTASLSVVGSIDLNDGMLVGVSGIGSQGNLELQAHNSRHVLLVLGGGNVGIGTADPEKLLTISGPDQQLALVEDDVSPAKMWKLEVNYEAFQITEDGVATRVTVDDTGMKYMAKTHNVKLSDIYSTYLEYDIDGSPWGVTKFASSERFKEDIADLELESEKIYDLRPVSFNWKPERGGGRDFGLIAEEVAKVIPLLAAYDDEGKPFSARYDMLPVLLLQQLKEKDAEIKGLNETMEQLKIRIDKLEQREN